jgi:hypothetical protein
MSIARRCPASYTTLHEHPAYPKERSPARRLPHRGTIAFPRELRDAIPNLHAGRVLELDSVNGLASNTALLGRVSLKLVRKETGKPAGEFVVRLDLQANAARQLAATLSQLADKADRSQTEGKP